MALSLVSSQKIPLLNASIEFCLLFRKTVGGTSFVRGAQ